MHRPLSSAAIAIGAVLFTATSCMAQEPARNVTEFGRVRWGRELEPALEASKESGKPVLLLFQEVPG